MELIVQLFVVSIQSYRSKRGFLVEGKTEGLVLLRVTDIAVSGANSHLTKLQASSLSSTAAILKAGVDKIYQFIESQTSA